MKRLALGVCAVALLLSSSSNAAVYKGQKEYVKKCRKCHGGGQALASSKTMDEWERIMSNDGTELIKLHLSDKKAKKALDYFQDKRFKKKARHIEDFLTEYAEDSGNVPACN